MSDVTVFGGSVSMPSSSALAEQLQSSLDAGGADASDIGDAEYLNFSGNTGVYTAGRDKHTPDSENIYIPNIAAFETGWVCWKGGKPVAIRMARSDQANVETPDMAEFGPFGDGEGWNFARATMLKNLDDGKQYYFRLNSMGGVRAIKDFVKVITDRVVAGKAAWPVVQLESESFPGKVRTNYKPGFKVIGWLNDDQLGVAFSDEDADLNELFALSEGESPLLGDATEAKKAEKPGRRRRTL